MNFRKYIHSEKACLVQQYDDEPMLVQPIMSESGVLGIELRAPDDDNGRLFIQLVRHDSECDKDMMAEIVLRMTDEGVSISLWTEGSSSLEHEVVGETWATWSELDDYGEEG